MSESRARRKKAVLALVAVLALGAGGLAWWLRGGPGDAIPADGQGGGGGGVMAPAALSDDAPVRLAAHPASPAARVGIRDGTPPPRSQDGASEPSDYRPDWDDIRISIVDAVTGRPLAAHALVRSPSLAIGPSTTRAGPAANARLTPIEAAPGFVAWEPAFFEFAPELATAGLSLVYPLHRAIELDMAVVDAEQRPADGAAVIAVAVDHRRFGGRVDALGAGRFRVHDLPYVPKGRVAVELTWTPEDATEAEVVQADSVLGDRPAWSGRMPDLPAASFRATVMLRGGRIREVPSPVIDHETADVSTGLGSIRVRVRRRDGQSALGARILLKPSRGQVLTAAGGITLREVPVGTRSVSLVDPRLVPTTVTVDVREGETTEVELVEPEAAGLDVTVVDADGKAVPVARVEVVTPSGTPALDLVDGVLRIDPYTDEIGRRTFTRVEPGVVMVRAWGRGGTGEAQRTLRPGARSHVTVVVK